MRIELQRAVEVRAGIHRTFPVVSRFATPEDHPTFAVTGLKFQPAIESINGTAGEKVAELARPHHDFHSDGITAPDSGLGATKGRDQLRGLA